MLELGDAAGPDEGRGHDGVAQGPGNGHLGQRLAAPPGDLVEGTDLGQVRVREHLLRHGPGVAGARAFRHAVEIAVCQEALRQGREDDAADPLLPQNVEQLGLGPPVEHRVRRLVDEQPRPHLSERGGGLSGAFRRVGGDAHVQRFAVAQRGFERPHRLLERSVRIDAM